MAPKQKNFNQYLEFGEEGEHSVADVLIGLGVSVMPLYQFNAKHAPYIISRYHNKLPLPDLLCYNQGAFFAEVKTKNQWVVYKDRIETGIDAKSYEQYVLFEYTTSQTVYLFFNHLIEKPLGIFFVRLQHYTRCWDGKVGDRQVYNPMVFYNFDVLNILSEENLRRVIRDGK
jgi:hypothetical protein